MVSVGEKRKLDDSSALVVTKKQKGSDGSIVVRKDASQSLIPAGVKRTSNLEGPIMLLTGHDVRFNYPRFIISFYLIYFSNKRERSIQLSLVQMVNLWYQDHLINLFVSFFFIFSS